MKNEDLKNQFDGPVPGSIEHHLLELEKKSGGDGYDALREIEVHDEEYVKSKVTYQPFPVPTDAQIEYNRKKEKYRKRFNDAVRKGQPVCTGVLLYFPNAIKAVSAASLAGNDQHHSDKPLHWDMSKSKDEADCLVRHLMDGLGESPMDDDGVHHLAKVAWRALALLERTLTNKF